VRASDRHFVSSLRFALRAIVASPGFAVAAALTFMVGLGVTTAAFSVVDAVLLRPLRYPNADRLYVVKERLPQLRTPIAGVNALHFREWRDRLRAFDGMSLIAGLDVNLSGQGEPERVFAARVSPMLFPMLGAQAEVGRTFTENEARPGGAHVVVLSHALWRRRFAADPHVVGRTITIDGQPHTIIGALSAGFALPKLRFLYDRPSAADEPLLWMPFASWDDPNLGSGYSFACIARLSAGVSPSRALAELNAVQWDIATRQPRLAQLQATLVPLRSQVVDRSRQSLQLIVTATALVLLIGCINVAHLLSARNIARRRDIAVRLALGANRLGLLWHALMEALVLAMAGGLGAVLLAFALLRIVQASASLDVPRLEETSIDARVLLFALAASLLSGVLAVVLPTWRLMGTDPIESLKAASGRTMSAGGRARWLLVSLEVAISTVLLIVGSVLLQSLIKVLSVSPGFDMAKNELGSAEPHPSALRGG
jgi:predicted permease